MNKLYIDPGKLQGHLLEYMHHYYMAALQDCSNTYYFVVGDNYDQIKKIFDWPSSPNIHIVVIENSTLYDDERSLLKLSYYRSRLLRHYVRKFEVHEVFLPFFMKFIPLLPISLVSTKAKVSGIIYNIAYYSNSKSVLRMTLNKIIYTIISKCRSIKTIYMLNSKKATSYYNNTYNTQKFQYLPDPFTNNLKGNDVDIRNEYHIKKDSILFCIFGIINEGKNLLNIVKAFTSLPQSISDKCSLLTMGEIDPMYRDEYDKIKNLYGKSFHWVTEEHFMPANYLNALVYTSNFLFMTYRNPCKSSGMFGYSSKYGTPVIAARGGLAEEIITQYNLGYCLTDIDDKTIADFIIHHHSEQIKITSKYIDKNNVFEFQKIIFEKS